METKKIWLHIYVNHHMGSTFDSLINNLEKVP